MSWPVVAQVVLSGLGAGVAYALVAVGVTLVAGLRGAVPLAQGDLAGGSTGLAVLLAVGTSPLAIDPSAGTSAVEILVALGVGIASGAVLFLLTTGFLGDRLAGLQATAVALAAGALVRDGLTHAFPRGVVSVGDPLHLDAFSRGTDGVLRLGGGTSIPDRVPATLVLGALLILVTGSALQRSRFGRGVRALSQDGELATLSGVDPVRASLGAYALAGVLAAAGGLLAFPGTGFTPDSGVLIGLTAFLAATAGGLGSLRGAVVAALVTGVAEAVVAHVSPSSAQPAVLGALVVAALVRGGGAAWAEHYR